MNTFNIIQNFFTRMACRYCGVSFAPNDVSLLEEGEGFFVVRIHCHDCGQHNGDAAVGVETAGEDGTGEMDPEVLKAMEAFAEELSTMPFGQQIMRRSPRPDPELTEADVRRLEDYDPISDEDVLNAHSFIQNLDRDWMKFIPPEIRQRHTEHDTE